MHCCLKAVRLFAVRGVRCRIFEAIFVGIMKLQWIGIVSVSCSQNSAVDSAGQMCYNDLTDFCAGSISAGMEG